MTLEALLLQDAVEQVAASPSAIHVWHALYSRFRATSDASLRTWCASQIAARIPADGIPGFLRAYFVALATGEREHTLEASRILLTIEPLHAERLLAFATWEWGALLKRSADRAGFVAGLRAARVPEIVAKLGGELARSAVAPWTARMPSRVERVALVTPALASRAHTPTNLALEYACPIRSAGFDLALFACQEVSIAGMSEFLPNAGNAGMPPVDRDALARGLPTGAQFHLSGPQFSLMRRWRDMLAAIARFDPDVVFFIGLFSPLVVPLFDARPVLALSINTVPPIVPADAWLTANPDEGGRVSDTWSPAIPPAWGIHHPYRIGANHGRARVPRAEMGIGEDAVAMVSVGYRLAEEIRDDWAARMIDVLRRHPGTVWMLIGGAGKLPPALASAPPGQVVVLPHQDELRGMLSVCDVYVNPPRMGGGFSIAEAMAEGLPVLCHANTDGADKIGPAAVDSDAAYFSKLESLLREPGLRRTAGDAMKARFVATLSLADSAEPLATALSVTLERFHLRKGRSANADGVRD